MKITEKQLRVLVREAIKNKMASLKENVGVPQPHVQEVSEEVTEAPKQQVVVQRSSGNRDFTAIRQIESAAKQASLSFEGDIVKLLNLIPPDELPGDLQERYYDIVQRMEDGFKDSVKNAIKDLSNPEFRQKSEVGE
jgi:dipeptidyl aminopeptidase/acylaminoacyl peptidase